MVVGGTGGLLWSLPCQAERGSSAQIQVDDLPPRQLRLCAAKRSRVKGGSRAVQQDSPNGRPALHCTLGVSPETKNLLVISQGDGIGNACLVHWCDELAPASRKPARAAVCQQRR